jgi:hypothetical protein
MAKRKRFKIGQELVCIKEDSWSFCGPKKNEIVIVDGYLPDELVNYPEFNFLYLVGYEQELFGHRIDFNELFFEPLVSDAVLEKELCEVFFEEVNRG